MNISSISINRPVLAIVMSIIIILFGCIGYKYLGVREYPSIDPPVITVRTNYSGANADVIESQITEPLEKAINGIEGVRTLTSSSAQGSSTIGVEFNLDANLEAAANDVRDKVSQVLRQLPQDIDGLPTVTKSDANSDAIVALTLQSDTKNQLQVSDFAENVIAERLQTIPGVSTVQIWGQKKYAMRLWMNPSKMAAYGITPQDVKIALDKENVELPSGKVAGLSTELTVNTKGKFTTEDEFSNMIVKSDGNLTVRFKDIGNASLGAETEETMLRQSGVPMIGLGLVPQPGANYISIADEFYKRVEQIKKDLPKDYQLGIALDNTKFIKRSILEVKETLIIAIVLVILIIYLFFRDWLIAFRPLIDIPVSLIGAFFIMYLMGYSINVLTLLAIVLATGLVVDDGIVVTENIFKKVEGGMNPVEAAHKGSKEIFFVVIATSITLAAVFMPVIFLEGFVGRLFREFGVVLASAVLISAFVSLSLTPMLNARMIRKTQKKSKFYEMTEPFFVGMVNSYDRSLARFMTKWWLGFVIVFLCGGFIFYINNLVPSELSPLEDRSWIRLSVTAPEGGSYEYTDAFMQKLSYFANDSIPEKKIFLTVTAPSFAGTGAVNSGFVRLVLTEPNERKRTQQQITDYLVKKTKSFPEAKSYVLQEQTISSSAGARGGLPVQFVLQAPNFEKLKEKLPLFMEEANKSKVFQAVDVNLKFNKPELNISIDRDKAKAIGVSVSDISSTLQLALSGQRFSYFNLNGKQYQVIGQLARVDRDTPMDLKSLYVKNNKGELIQLDNMVTMKEQSSPPQLYHYNRYQSAIVSAGLATGKTIGDGNIEMKRIADKVLDDSFATTLAGSSRDFSESSSNILFAFMLALVIIYLVLAAQFESFIDPFTIMLTVPLALCGALLSLWYFNQTLNIFSEIGIIMLIGLVTKNGILIVEFANQLKEQGKSHREAIQLAAAARLRPILMTSMATSLGALPIALALGAGAKSRMAMGIVVVGGVLFSLILTLYVIPSVYYYLPLLPSIIKNKIKQFIKFIKKLFPNKLNMILIICFCSSFIANAQTSQMTIEQAVEVALKNNYDISIAKNLSKEAENSNTLGNAGMLPTVSLNASGSLANNATKQEFSTGQVIDKSGVQSQNINTGAYLTWTVFDGLKMFATHERLKELESMGMLNTKIQIENTLVKVISSYYSIVMQKEMINGLKENIVVSEERLKIANKKFEIGTASKVDVLQAKVDMNAQKSALMREKTLMTDSKETLNQLLLLPVDKDFDVTDSIPLMNDYKYEDLKNAVTSKNSDLLFAQKNIDVSKYMIKEAKSLYYPKLNLNANYLFTRSENQAGFTLLNQNLGLNLGFTASWTIFNGFNNSNAVKNLKLDLENSNLTYESTKTQIQLGLIKAFKKYQDDMDIVKLEEENNKLAKENLDIAFERFKVGNSNSIELKTAQQSFQESINNLSDARYNAKISETQLLKLTGGVK